MISFITSVNLKTFSDTIVRMLVTITTPIMALGILLTAPEEVIAARMIIVITVVMRKFMSGLSSSFSF